MKILFVCTGNTCRSPMAEGIFNHYAPEGSSAASAGMMAVGGRVSEKSEAVCKKHGIDISDHRPVQLTGLLVQEADLALTMTADHAEYMQWLYPAEKGKIMPLLDYVTGARQDVSDPYGGDESVYESCFAQLSEAVCALIKKLGARS